MNHLNIYSTVAGELPKLCSKNKPKCFIPYEELLSFLNELVKIYTDKTHTAYENEQYANFLLKKIGLGG